MCVKMKPVKYAEHNEEHCFTFKDERYTHTPLCAEFLSSILYCLGATVLETQ